MFRSYYKPLFYVKKVHTMVHGRTLKREKSNSIYNQQIIVGFHGSDAMTFQTIG